MWMEPNSTAKDKEEMVLLILLVRKNVLRQVQSDGKQNGVDLRDTLSREIRSSTSNPNMRQRMPEPTRLHISEPMDVSIFSRIPSTRSADALPQIDSLRNSYSPWTLDRLRRRSPDETFRTSRGRSPRRNEEELPKRPLMRIYDDVRTVPYMSKDVLEPSRPKGSSPFVTKSTVSSGPVKAVAPPPPPSSSIVQEKFIHSTDY
ncbi:uncharacterized protein LOC132294926 [Cornus florida]|uniref:uncharacterized protein LOC132294926 n=1 Tax=Cornus florida TaxID=4283 RepID=UPI00289889C0|nr:uncharacterized protein LOC132294926 [Cornus florida]XP_059648937.1 uncharacterized protein LOC132294926 [Cornus florida]XP_059648938.1 uncharacterized protein LOC132294926 [Cornus florida]